VGAQPARIEATAVAVLPLDLQTAVAVDVRVAGARSGAASTISNTCSRVTV
jgi:hypothetical protein